MHNSIWKEDKNDNNLEQNYSFICNLLFPVSSFNRITLVEVLIWRGGNFTNQVTKQASNCRTSQTHTCTTHTLIY